MRPAAGHDSRELPASRCGAYRKPTAHWQPQARGSSSHDTPQRSASQPEARSRQPRARSATPRTEVRYSYAFRLILGWGRLGPGARPDRDAVRTHALSCRYAIVDLAIIGSWSCSPLSGLSRQHSDLWSVYCDLSQYSDSVSVSRLPSPNSVSPNSGLSGTRLRSAELLVLIIT